MLRSQKLEIKSVEIRGRLSELAGLDSLEEDQRTELKEKTAELRQVEEQRVAALEVEALGGSGAEHERDQPPGSRGEGAEGGAREGSARECDPGSDRREAAPGSRGGGEKRVRALRGS